MKDKVYTLHLSPGFDPLFYYQQIKLEFILDSFPGGEPNFRITTEASFARDTVLYITQRFSTPSDIVNILVANDAARRYGFKTIRLILPYFPAARQDRVCNEGESLTVKIFADMINSCGFDEVTILSPHSEVTPALLNTVRVLDECKYVEQALYQEAGNSRIVNVICPDAGAGKRVSKVVSYLSKRFPYNTVNLIRCEKERDVRDGKLKGFHVSAEDLGGHPTMIIDDIVAYGGTFVGLGQILRERKCGKLMLFVSHADCDKGISNMTEFFDHVFVSNSRVNNVNSKKLTTYNISL